MASITQQKKIKTLFEQSMQQGGLAAFRTNWEQSIGLVDQQYSARDSEGTPHPRTRRVFDREKREVDFRDFTIGETAAALLGPHWRNSFEQFHQRAAALRFEGNGGTVMSGELPYVSAAIDVIAGLANARALERPTMENFIWDQMCGVTEIVGEGGFDIITRTGGDKPSRDLADGQPIPTSTLTSSRVHRNRTLNQGLRVKINKYTILDDLTGTLYQSIDENADQVLLERERKVADAVLGISLTKGGANTFALTVSQGASIGEDDLAIPVVQDGLTFFPYQKGTYGSNAGSAAVAPENGKLIRNYGNCNFTDGAGLTDYNALVRALTVLTANRDPFSGRPLDVPLNGMTFLVTPASRVQLDFLLQAQQLWQVAANLTAAGGKNTVSGYNYFQALGLNIVTSQYWFNRLVDVGTVTLAANGTYAHQTLNATAGYSTVASIHSAMYMGHFKRAVKYAQRLPYTVVQVPLSSQEYAEEVVLVQDVRERGQAYWVDPRLVWRAWA